MILNGLCRVYAKDVFNQHFSSVNQKLGSPKTNKAMCLGSDVPHSVIKSPDKDVMYHTQQTRSCICLSTPPRLMTNFLDN